MKIYRLVRDSNYRVDQFWTFFILNFLEFILTLIVKGSVQKKICSYFVSLRHEEGGGVHPNVFVSQSGKNEQMFDTDFFKFFVFNIKAREKHTLGKWFDGTIFFLPEKK